MSNEMSTDVFKPAAELAEHMKTLIHIKMDSTVQLPTGIERSAVLTVALDSLTTGGVSVCFVSIPHIIELIEQYNPSFDYYTPQSFRSSTKEYDVIVCERLIHLTRFSQEATRIVLT